ncbi:MAG TPA: alpha/beta hydrolase [Amnibacterium sp.]|uniref:alpha/beta hydrolase n=1 Tax=Amnibacterium sp. TaxID=1872496 RepID=UPI002F9561DA
MAVVPRVPVWLWSAVMSWVAPRELRRFNRDPITEVDYRLDLDYAGDGLPQHRLDVLIPKGATAPLPVYVYFHGGGWTSGDKAALTKYCASQAIAGMVVVNANYRRARPHHMGDLLEDADAVLRWTRDHIADHGGDPARIVLGGDSAGGQIAALTAAMPSSPELATHHGIRPALPAAAIRGLVQHCSMADFRLALDGRIPMGRDFVRMLLPDRGRGTRLRDAARYLSPVDWIGPDFPPTFISSSSRDFLHTASRSLHDRLRSQRVAVDALFLGPEARTATHTWQQDAGHAESAAVYRRLQAFIARVSGPVASPA